MDCARSRCAGDDDRSDEDDDGAPASVAADIVPQITFDPWTASPVRVLGVSAVADGDERLDASPDIGAAAPERPGLVKPCTADDQGDRHTAPIVIAGLCTSSRLPSGHQRRIVAVACPPSAKADPRPSRMPPSPSAAPVRVSLRALPLPKMTMTMTIATAHRRVRPLPPCRTSPPGDELRDPCAPSPSVPPPMATSAATPCPTAMQPSLHDPAPPSPTPSTTGATSSLRRQRSQAASPRPACRSTDRFLVGSASYALATRSRATTCNTAPPDASRALTRRHRSTRSFVLQRVGALTVSISNLCPPRRLRASVLTPDAAGCQTTTTLRSGTRRLQSATILRRRA